ncbi:MAG: DUF3237 domain-containing protein [Burkholderiaceae bacterium]|nr:DUF3237 domain-containing protein [Burkholderiaceae bacterium]
MIKTDHLFDLTLQLGELVSVGAAPQGERRVAGIRGGTLTGALLNGDVVCGSDNQLLRHDGVLEIDATYVVRLTQGGQVRIVNQGYRYGPEEVLAQLARGDAVPADRYYFRSVLRFETGDPALEWLNKTIAVAQAERQGGNVVFRVFRLQ